VEPAFRLPDQPEDKRWMVEDLWLEQAVGIIGGEPKCCKSFLALDIAVSVASATPCLRHFAVDKPGRVLLYAAEDPLHVVRERLYGISAAAGVRLENLDLEVITAPTLRLDLGTDRTNLAETVAAIRPRLLLLDPFIRLHRIDENASGEVAPLLAFLRELQRLYNVAVILVHHARKGAGRIRGGQALRGSSEFHAWGDSNLYMRRDGNDHLSLSVEHRAAASITARTLNLVRRDKALALELVAKEPQGSPAGKVLSLDERIIAALSTAQPRPLADLRANCRARTATLCERLNAMAAAGRIGKSGDGWYLLPLS